MNERPSPANVEVITFGCRLNAVESEAMRRAAANVGDERPLVIVNTCAVTGEAMRQARQSIRRAARERPDARLIVTGCGAQTSPESFAAMPEVSHVLGNAQKRRAATWAALDTAPRVDVAPAIDADRFDAAHVVEGRTRAFVEIQNGCDHRCTFCIIPYGRGASRSAAMADIVTRTRALVDAGCKEVVLTGVDLTSYGGDIAGAPKLGTLTKAILREVPDLTRLRLSSIDCIEADPDLIEAFADEPRLMPHLHLSLQAGDDLILKRMKRRHSRDQAIEFCALVRRLRPDIVFGADFIAGFPTETEDMFAHTVDLVEECGLTHLHVFPFSPREGTPAARMPPVPREIARQRAARLREKGDGALAAHLSRQVGRRLEALTERGGVARARDFTLIRAPGQEAGKLIDMRITGHDGRALLVGETN